MGERLKVGDFYQPFDFNWAIEIDNLDKAFFVKDTLYVTTKDAPIILQQFSLKQKAKTRQLVLPYEKIGGVAVLGEVVCFYFQDNQDLWVLVGQKIIGLKSHFQPITALVANNGNIVTGSIDMTIRIWNPINSSLVQDQKLHALSGHTGAIKCFLSIQGYLLSASSDNYLILWKQYKIFAKKQFPSGIKLMIQCSQSNQIAVYEQNNTISIINSILLKQKKLVVNRVINELQNLPLVGLHEMDDSFLELVFNNAINVAQINLGTVMAKISIPDKVEVVASKCVRRITLLAVKMRGLFIIKF